MSITAISVIMIFAVIILLITVIGAAMIRANSARDRDANRNWES